MFVNGPIGTIVTGSGGARRVAASNSTAAFGPGGCRRWRQHGVADPADSVDLRGPNAQADERTLRATGHRNVRPPVQLQQPQRVLRAMVDVGVPADRRDREQVDLRPRDREPDRERVVESWVAVDDHRKWLVRRPDRRGSRDRAAG